MITRIRKTKVSLLAALLLAMSAASVAGEQERAELAQLAKEVAFLMQRAGEIQSVANTHPQDQIAFRYDDLIRDLGKIKEGLSDYIGAELRDGNPITPLDGRYR
jgi:RAQPRD family integrative conjugative element protein